MKSLFLHSPTMPNTTNEAFLDTLLPHDVLGIIFDQVVNQSQAMHDISSILLTCKNGNTFLRRILVSPCYELFFNLTRIIHSLSHFPRNVSKLSKRIILPLRSLN